MSDDPSKPRKTVKPNLKGMQLEWVLAYIADPKRNATEAARKAGYKNPEQSGWENRRNPSIQAYIKEFYEQQEATAAEAVAVLSRQMRGSMRDFLVFETDEQTGEIIGPTLDLKKAAAAGYLDIIKEYEETETILRRSGDDDGIVVERRRKIKPYDAQAAADKLIRFHGGYTDNVKIKFDPSSMSDDELNDLDNSL
jgi:hypothetical protein